MTAAEFDAILSARLDKIKSVLASKGAEYASDKDRLHNFKRAASDFPSSGIDGPADALLGMMRKHWVSIADLVDRKATNGEVGRAAIDEKIGDAINYLILLEAILVEPCPA